MTIKDDLIGIKATLADLETKVAGILVPTSGAVDLTPVLTAISDVSAKADAIKAEFVETPTAPAA